MLGMASLLKIWCVAVPRGASAPVLPARKAVTAAGLLVGCPAWPSLSDHSALRWGSRCVTSFHMVLARVTGLPLQHSSGTRLRLCEKKKAAE